MRVCTSCHSLRGKHGVGRIDIVENRFIGMKSRGKELKYDFFSFGFFNLFQITVAGFRFYALWALSDGVFHCENTPQDFNFISVQKPFFWKPGAFMQFAVILCECFKWQACYSASIRSGLHSKRTLFKGNVSLWFTWNHRCWLTSNHVRMHTQ